MTRPLTTADALAMVAQKERRVQHPALLPVGAPTVAPMAPCDAVRVEFDRLNALSRQRALTDEESDALERVIHILDGAILCPGCGAQIKKRKTAKTGMCNRCWQVRLSTWTPEMDARLLAMTANKERLSVIAAALGRTRTACRKRRDRLAVKAFPFSKHHTVADLDAQEAAPCKN